MAKYSKDFRESILVKILPPQNRSKKEVATEAGLTIRTIDNWLKKARENTLDSKIIPPDSKTLNEKITLVFESKAISASQLPKWLREKGLHSEHIQQWEQEIRSAGKKSNETDSKTVKDLKLKNKTLEKDLLRKEKALAEMAALYTLKKKAQEIWGDHEEDL